MKSPYPFQILLLETVRKRERAAMLSVCLVARRKHTRAC